MSEHDTEDCIFCRIARGQVPASIVHEDEYLIAFEDVDPKAPRHLLVIPRRHVASVDELEPDDVELAGRMVLAAAEIARREGLTETGYRLVTNTGRDAGQSVDHWHVHLLAGRPLAWPPG